ncbi:hypothetical protein Lal_00024119, partial [Lupinus albus]
MIHLMIGLHFYIVLLLAASKFDQCGTKRNISCPLFRENMRTCVEKALLRKDTSKNKRMPLKVSNTRYSLVKGERIVRFVYNTRLRCARPKIKCKAEATHERPNSKPLKWSLPLKKILHLILAKRPRKYFSTLLHLSLTSVGL